MRGSRGHGDGGGGGRRRRGEAAALLAALLGGLLLLTGGADAQGIQRPTAYKTLKGDAPLVIAKGGFAGVFPGYSTDAYAFALIASAPDTSLWCDVQLTKDGVGICLGDINMSNNTDISQVYRARKNKYVVDGMTKAGWFSVDFNMSELQSVILTQAIWSRTDKFDYYSYPILSVTDLQSMVKPPSVWLNVQHDIFYTQHGLNMTSYILSILKRVSVKYISSPELGFLQSLSRRVSSKTKLVYRFPDITPSDPSTNKTYNSMLSNLTFIKTIASGIMVPKSYIWPVSNDNYLQPPIPIVQESHKAGLEIYASDFANDRIIPYNYSYDPLQEYLSFTSGGDFSVDGVLTEYPITASEAIGCFAKLNPRKVDHGKPLVISHNGASGDYPDCTDLAYQNAIKDGADMIDCTLQVTSDGVLICMSSINLFDTTNVQTTSFSNPASVFPDIPGSAGVFTFNLTWNNISTALKPKISSPLSTYYLVRNPRYTNQGKFVKFSDFLEYGKDKDLSGIMLIIENAAFMAKSLGFDIIESVTTALSDAGYSNQTTKEVMIQSKDSAVLVKFKQQKTKYKLVYTLPTNIGDASNSSLADVKEFADAVVVQKSSVFAQSLHFIIKQTSLVKELQSAGLAVYVQWFRNEFVTQPWDFFCDETVEINSYVQTVKVDGLITDFPKTVSKYKRNSCANMGTETPVYMQTVTVGDLANLLKSQGVPGAQPPALAPMPELNATSMQQPPFPPVAAKNAPLGTSPPPGSAPSEAYVDAVLLADKKWSGNVLKIALPVVSSLLIVISVCLVWICKCKGKQRNKNNWKKVFYGTSSTSAELREGNLKYPFISFRQIVLATNNFSNSNMLGHGGFGNVYRGTLGNEEIAVKRLSKGSGQGVLEFTNEVILIAKLQHKNLVRLLGFCIHGDEKLLIYEYLPNKSLDAVLFNATKKSMLGWPTRFEIIKGIARGLLYLHQDSRLKIIHRDLKASNILLDAEMSPKISDFGMARIFGSNQQQGNTNRVVGTYGYMSPEYALEGVFSVKSDVYSFGVLLLEIVSGSKISSMHLKADFSNIITYAWSLWRDGSTKDFVDSSIVESCSLNETLRCIHIGLLCVQNNPNARPLMSSTISFLENGDISLPHPKQPIYFAEKNKETDGAAHDTVRSANNMSVTVLEGR